MASGSIYLSSSKSAYGGRIDWYSSTNTSSNTSSVYAYLYIWVNGNPATSGTFTGYLNVGGNSISISNYHSLSSTTGEVCTAELSDTVNHSSDGIGSCYIEASISGPSGTSLSGAVCYGSGSATLDKIPRASSISSASNIYLGNKCEVAWTPLATSFYYKLKFTFGDQSYTTSAIHPETTSAYSYTSYTIPLNWASQIPNATSGMVYVYLYTYDSSSCSNQIGSTASSSFTVTLPDSVVPSIGTCSTSLVNTSNNAIESWGIAIAGYTKVNISATASGAYGSTINSFTISGSYNTSVTGSSLNYTGSVITTSGNKQFIVTCTDSRGRTSSAYTSDIISFLSYTIPKVKKLTMTKNTRDDSDTSNDRMVALATWEYDSINGYNSATAQVYYKVSSATDWTVHSGYLKNGEQFELSNLIPDELLSYNFKVVVTDALGNSAEKDAFSSTITVLLDFKAGGDGLGIGKICEEAGMEVSMDTVFFNEIYIKNRQQTLEDYILTIAPSSSEIVNIVYPVGSIYMSVSSTSPAALFGGSWSQLSGQFLLAANSSYTLGTTGGEPSHTLTVNEMPAHTHGIKASVNTRMDNTVYYHNNWPLISDPSMDNTALCGSTGGGAAHNNMPPYLAVNMWKRVA